MKIENRKDEKLKKIYLIIVLAAMFFGGCAGTKAPQREYHSVKTEPELGDYILGCVYSPKLRCYFLEEDAEQLVGLTLRDVVRAYVDVKQREEILAQIKGEYKHNHRPNPQNGDYISGSIYDSEKGVYFLESDSLRVLPLSRRDAIRAAQDKAQKAQILRDIKNTILQAGH